MRSFFGGQIKEKYRGNLATVINRERGDGYKKYNIFVYPIDSEEFVHLTGMGEVNNPLERVYIGVSPEIGNSIASQVNEINIAMINLMNIDREIVIPFFLDRYPEKPNEIVLRSTSEGYKITSK